MRAAQRLTEEVGQKPTPRLVVSAFIFPVVAVWQALPMDSRPRSLRDGEAEKAQDPRFGTGLLRSVRWQGQRASHPDSIRERVA